MSRVLLVEPSFPIPHKSHNHKAFLPIGLLKIGSYLRNNGVDVRLARGCSKIFTSCSEQDTFQPHEIWITSLFTYWAEYVKQAVHHYKEQYPNAVVVVGGIYASLFPPEEVLAYTRCDRVHQGVVAEAENCLPAYDLLNGFNGSPIDYQILHASRGCERRCSFCGTWRIENEFNAKRSIKDEIIKKKLVFYDNNFLANPWSEDILSELIELRNRQQLIWCESQSGFDGRLLLEKPQLASMLKAAGFRYPRIAWDWGFSEYERIYEQVKLLVNAGFRSRDIYVFVLYNWDISFEEMEKKRIKCWEWNVQIADCRYRPLNQLYDNYVGLRRGQTTQDYYIHEKAGWNDAKVKQFRRNVREQNICVRHGFDVYCRAFENKQYGFELRQVVRNCSKEEKDSFFLENCLSAWSPGTVRAPLCHQSSIFTIPSNKLEQNS